MHNTSALWKQIFAEIDHQTEVKVTINGVEYGQDRIIRASVVGRLFDAPSVGGAVSRTLDLEIAPYEAPFGAVPPMSEIKLFVRLVSADGESASEYIQKGVFYADTVKRDADTGVAEITAFDAMMKADHKLNDRACSIAFYDGFGGVQKFSGEVGDNAPTPTTPLKPGYAFAAWNPAPEAVVTRDMNCAALWRRSSAVAEGDGWALYDNGLLHIFFEGDMPNYRYSILVPWLPYRTQITSVTISDSVTSIGKYAFDSCSRLTSVTIPNSVTSIGGAAFCYCSGLTSVTIPDSVTSIGSSAFLGCTHLTSVTIGGSVTSIGSSAFQNCIGLTSVTIPDSVTSIRSAAFRYCRGLTSVTIGDSVTNIENYAFGNCTSLTSVRIPNSVINIGANAFQNCGSLTDVFYGGSESQWNAIAVGSDNAPLASATIHFNSSGPA